MIPKIFWLVVFYLFSISVKAQFSQYIIELKDKANSPFSISKPEQFLSQRAIERRKKQGIPIVENDLPVNPAYIDSIRLSGDVTINNTSKWLNQVCIETNDATAIEKISAFSFVKNYHPVKRIAETPSMLRKFDDPILTGGNKRIMNTASFSYGGTEQQIKIHNGDYLHDRGYTGKGMLIAVIDDGFYHYQSLPAFDSIRLTNRILDTYDFVDNKTDMNMEDAHGMYCLSLIAANIPGQMVGSAPGASFLLYRSENVHAEYPGEEQNWVAAAERSDSAGADVISTSLGYNTFDNPIFNHTYQDMNGHTTIIARGANIAASKGMILMIAAGNEGSSSWHYIITPGDAINVLTVGAVDVNSNPAAFSSYGPSSDGRVKPDVASVGVANFVQATNGGFAKGNGTSFATPNLAGLVTCLWQAFPDFNSTEIMDIVRKSSSRFSSPDDRVGYGIPDFEKAFKTLTSLRIQRQASEILKENKLIVFPNPVNNTSTLLVKVPVSGTALIKWYDASGKMVFSQTENVKQEDVNIIQLKRNALARGVYILHFVVGGEKYSQKIIIQ